MCWWHPARTPKPTASNWSRHTGFDTSPFTCCNTQLEPTQCLTLPGRHADATLAECFDQIVRVLVCGGGDCRHNDLNGSEPEGQMAGMVFKENADETFQRTEQGAVQHDGRMLVPIRADIMRVQTLRQIEIDLHGTALPVSSDCIMQHKFQLGTVKGAFPRIARVGKA